LDFTSEQKLKAIELIIAEARTKLSILLQSMQAAYDETTHQESKQEGKYDTRAIEAGYLAGAQAERVKILDGNVATLERLAQSVKASDTSSPELTKVKVGSVVVLSDGFVGSEARHYIILPCLGGYIVENAGLTVTSITSNSPLGAKLLGCSLDDEVTISQANNETNLIISAIY
jgi:transcription elongation GreA/GreB family factor